MTTTTTSSRFRNPFILGCLGVLAVLVAVVAYPAFWLTRFLLGEEPTLTTFPFSDHNAEIATIPVSERAWPLYPDLESPLFTEFGEIQLLEPDDEFMTEPTPEDEAAIAEHEALISEFLRTHADDLQQIRDAAAKPHLGAQIRVVWRGDPIDRDNEPSSLNVMLPEFSTENLLMNLLEADAALALDTRDHDRVLDNAEAIFRIGQQFREIPAIIADRYALRRTLDACELLTDLIGWHQRSLSEAQLARAAALADTMLGTDHAMRFELERRILDDYAQRLFTDNGRGNGRFIRGSLEPFENIINMGGQQLFPENTVATDLAIALSGDRADFVRVYTEHFDQIEAWNEGPLWERTRMPTISPSIDVTVTSIAERLIGANTSGLALAHHGVLAKAGAVRIRIGVARYQAKHGTLPGTLEDLVPAHLDEIPTDPWSGEPLRLAIHDGFVTVYSTGPDADDDGARQIDSVRPEMSAAVWTWQTLGVERFGSGTPDEEDLDGDLILSTTNDRLLQ